MSDAWRGSYDHWKTTDRSLEDVPPVEDLPRRLVDAWSDFNSHPGIMIAAGTVGARQVLARFENLMETFREQVEERDSQEGQ